MRPRIHIRKLARRGKTEWVVDARLQGKRHRTFHSSKTLAQAHAEQLQLQVNQAGSSWLALPAAERNQIMLVAEEIGRAGLSVATVWSEYQRLSGKPSSSRTLAEAINECLESKQAANRRPSYVASLRWHLRQFASGRETIRTADINSQDVLEWFRERSDDKPATRASTLTRLSSFFTWCVKRGYASSNPCAAVDRVQIEQKPPVILSPFQAARLVVTCLRKTPRLLPWLILGLFAGLRPEEADKLTWDAWDAKPGTLRVDAAASKVRTRRIVPLEPCCQAWLTLCREKSLPMSTSHTTRRRMQRDLRGACGWASWPADVLRHTAASYLVALHHDVGRVARTLGNSPSILLRHYTELVSPDVAQRFWAIKPKARHLALTLQAPS